ncbi:hypothetical protein MKW98_009132 [Papaver atlanticum]|uniref:SWIM-type domain-containing protein n=1 Tax=Papaver atlanticum TaxID=357466 RepID=A0AAD4XS30_9MAGN|nr:hypothetical protein MKW98_009132 [Papaver atlanticum]
MAKLQELSPKAVKEVRDLGVELWARVKARKPLFSMMTTNPAESFNSTLKPAKKLSLVLLMDFIRRTLAEWFAIRKKIAKDWMGKLSSKATEIIVARNQLAISFWTIFLGGGRYEVTESGCQEAHEVNLEERTCSCGRFQTEFLPCLHALAVIKTKKYTTNFSVCGVHWRTSAWRSAYQGTIELPLTVGRWDLPQDIQSRKCLHPDFKYSAGRPKLDRYRGWSEKPKPPANQQRRCSKCGAEGHYRTTCPK